MSRTENTEMFHDFPISVIIAAERNEVLLDKELPDK